MRPLTFSIPFLPPSFNVYRNERWPRQRAEEKTWKDYVAVKWAELGRPKMRAVRIAMIFSFPDKRTRDWDNYLSTGSKLVGDAVKGLFIPDDSPAYLKAWSFRFEVGKEAQTTVVIEDVGKAAPGDGTLFPEGFPTRLNEGVASGASSGLSADQASAPRRGAKDAKVADFHACKLYEGCTAQLCPLDPTSPKRIWYADEEICRSRMHGNLAWIKAQRKLAKVGAAGYFTIGMLERLTLVRKGIAGLDPNIPEGPQLSAWLQKRAEKPDAPFRAKVERTRHLKNFSFKKQAEGEG